jgi:rhodanese-related sulfurtransferase
VEGNHGRTTRIDVHELKHRLDAGEPIVLLDTRSAESWEMADAQIPGSIRVPPDDVRYHAGEIPLNRPVVTYCT